jgi:site-specific DNA recombinase
MEWARFLRPEEHAEAPMKEMPRITRKIRCAIYTRKSSEEGLEQEFNSLDAQREACEAYIVSQKAEGWLLVPARYDDGGFSGGTLERPALQRLIKDIEAKQIDTVVVYKIDRLSRSLMDFARLVEVFDGNNVSFVSITQAFSTVSAMGKLTLNILLSFAQFERELTGERIRDKFAASRRRGIFMGGWAPLGYDIKDRRLIVNEREALVVRSIFTRFARGILPRQLTEMLAKEGALNKRGKSIDKGYLYRILNNRVYIGKAMHKGMEHKGEHQSIIEQNLWDQVHALISASPHKRRIRPTGRTPSLLKGLFVGPTGAAMTPSHTRKNGRLYRYYSSIDAIRNGQSTSPVRRVAADQIEAIVITQIKTMLQTPEIVVATWRAARKSIKDLTERQVWDDLRQFDALWSELFPAEQARIIQLLVERVELLENGADITLRTDGLGSLIHDLRAGTGRNMDAA